MNFKYYKFLREWKESYFPKLAHARYNDNTVRAAGRGTSEQHYIHQNN